MALFYGGALPLLRQLKGLLLPGLPRGRIEPRAERGSLSLSRSALCPPAERFFGRTERRHP
jgi:hypothetical protein